MTLNGVFRTKLRIVEDLDLADDFQKDRQLYGLWQHENNQANLH